MGANYWNHCRRSLESNLMQACRWREQREQVSTFAELSAEVNDSRDQRGGDRLCGSFEGFDAGFGRAPERLTQG